MAQMSGRLELVAERTSTASEDVSINYDFSLAKAVIFILRVSAVATDGTDNLDLILQQGFDLPATDQPANATTLWDDFLAFIQVGGDETAPVEQRATWHRDVAPTTDFSADVNDTLADDVLQGPISGKIQAAAIVTSGSSPSFTWALYAWVLEDPR